jgi:hypothetical protein
VERDYDRIGAWYEGDLYRLAHNADPSVAAELARVRRELSKNFGKEFSENPREWKRRFREAFKVLTRGV